jgi:signal peptide peptidase SppA
MKKLAHVLHVLYVTVALVFVGVLTIEAHKNTGTVKISIEPSKKKISSEEAEQANIIPVGLLELNGNIADTWPLIMRLHAYLKNDDIKAILIRLNGAGDALGFSYALYHELTKAQEQKPIIALIDEQCLEGCYYIASGAQFIIAAPTASIGLIGAQQTIARYRNVHLRSDHQAAEVDFTVLSQGKYKTMFDPHAGRLTPEQEALISQMLQEQYDQFCHDIAKSRHLDLNQREEWAEGRYTLGRKAVQVGLIDRLGSYSSALELIKELLVQRGEDAEGEIVLVKAEGPRKDIEGDAEPESDDQDDQEQPDNQPVQES